MRRALSRCGAVGLILAGVLVAATAVLYAEGGAAPVQTAGHPATPAKPVKKAATPAINLEDEGGRAAASLAHLNAVLRFYRDTEAPIQKVGEPSDLVYRNQVVAQATQIADFAFEAAKQEAALQSHGQASAGAPTSKLQQTRITVEQRIAALKTRRADLARAVAAAPAKKRAALEQQLEQVDGELELQSAMAEALGRIAGMADLTNDTGFAAQVGQLEHSAPGVTQKKSTVVAPTLENFNASRNAGVSSQATVLFHLLSTRGAIDKLEKEADRLHKQAMDVRAPLITQLKKTLAEGEALSQTPGATFPAANGAANATSEATATAAKTGSANTPSAATSAAAVTPASAGSSFDELTATFKALSSAAVPLSQEMLTLEQTQATLQAWRTAVNDEYKLILESLLTRVGSIAIALLVIFGLGEVWRRAAKRYVHDIRRRRQLLVVRRLLTGFLTGLVLIFGFVTQFSSLATFAGFITAGIAVGLQTILLSVAAYFFIIGRFGIKVGDRISIGAVTGDVVEVGIVRFYVSEMSGSGTDLYATGRVAVFSNAVLFQAGTPLFKQMPGTQYAWHELTVKLSPEADYRPAVQEIVKALQGVYEGYRPQVERQHKSLELWMDSSIDSPGIQSNLLLVDGGLQFWVRFPVMIRQAAVVDEKMTEALLDLIARDPKVKAAVSGSPVIKATVKG